MQVYTSLKLAADCGQFDVRIYGANMYQWGHDIPELSEPEA